MGRLKKLALTLSALAAVGTTLALLLGASAPQVPSDTWAPTGDMATSRAGSAAALLPDGRVLATGGTNGTAVTSTAERYSPAAGSFLATPAMQDARANHSATLLADGRVLVAGGVGADGHALASAEIYDAVSNSWAPVAPLYRARAGQTATLLADGRVLMAGGDDAGAAIDSLEVFDPVAGVFSQLASTLSSPRTGHAAALLGDGRVLLVGGFNGTNALASTDVFDATGGDAVSGGPSLGTARAGASATTLLDGTVFVAGGASDTAELGTTEIFNPATNAFAPGATLAVARQRHQAFLLPHNNNVLIVGGTQGGNAVATAELYQPWNYTMLRAGAPSVARAWTAGSALSYPADKTIRTGPNDGLLLLAGGSAKADASSPVKSAELYGFATVKTDKEDYAPGTTVTITGSGWQPGETVALTLVEQPLLDTHPLLPVTADGNGNITSTEFVPDEHDIGITFFLTAYGSASQVQTTFRDNKNLTITFAGTGSGSVLMTPTAPAGSTATLTASGSFGIDNSQIGTLTATDDPGSTFTGWTGTFVSGGTTTCTGTTSPCNFSMSNSAQALTATFLKNDFVGTVTVGAQTGSVTYGTAGSVTYLVTVTRGTSTGAFTANLSIGSLPSGVSLGSFTSASLSFASGDASKTSTLTLNTTAGAFAQSGTSFTVTATDAALAADTRSGNGTLTLNKRAITVTAATNTKPYDGSTTAAATPTITSGTLVNLNTANFTETYDTASAGTNKTLTPSGTVTDGNSGNNYAYTFVTNTTGVISKVHLTVTADVKSRVYGAANPTFTATITGFVNGETVAVVSGTPAFSGTGPSSTATTTVGSYVITPGVGTLLATNYDFTPFNNGTLTITKAHLTVSADAKSRAYGAANPAFTATITGFVNSETVSVVSGTPAFSGTGPSSTTTTTVGSYLITPAAGSLSATNYDFTSFVDGTLTVTKSHLTVTADAKSRAYGAANPTFTATITGFVNGDTMAVVSGSPTFSGAGPSSTATTAAGPYVITPAVGTLTAANYDFTPFADGTLTITKVHLTVTADAKSRAYGAANPTFTATITGFANGETVAVVSGSPSFSGTGPSSTATTAVGSYVITPSVGSLSSTNYDFTPFVDGALTISTAPLTVTANSRHKTYGVTLTAVDYSGTLSGLVPGDIITASYDSPTGDPATATVAGNTYPILATLADPGSRLGNYTVTNTPGALTVDPALLTVTANNRVKTYGQTVIFAGTEFTAMGLSNSDSVTSVTLTSAGAAANASVAGSPYSIVPSAAVGSGLGNYTISYVNGSLTVNQAATLTSVASDHNPAATGQLITYTATVISGGGVPTGSVIFYDGVTVLGTGTLDVAGHATLATSSLTVGTHPISAAYGGSLNFFGSASSALSQVVDTPPTAAADTFSLFQDTTLASGAPGVLANDNDAEGATQTVTAVLVSGPLNASAFVLNANGSFTYTPNPGFTGTDSFTYMPFDGVLNGNTVTVSLTILAAGASPVAEADAYHTTKDTLLAVAAVDGVLNNDHSALPITAVLVTGPAHASAFALNADGSFSYTPNTGFAGFDSFTYKANDGSTDSSVQQVLIAVVASAATLVANNDNYTVDQDGTLVKTAGQGVLANDTGAAAAALVLAPLYGAVALAADGSFTYTPAAGFNGVDSFLYRAVSGPDASNVAMVSIRVRATATFSNLSAPTIVYGTATTTLSGKIAAGSMVPPNTEHVSITLNGVTQDATIQTDGTFSSGFDTHVLDVSSYTIAYSYAGDDTFTPATDNTKSLTVTKAPLSVTANDKSRIYGDANPAFDGSVVGLKNGDNITATFSTTATQASPAATYAITAALSDPDTRLPNYDVTYHDGTLTIGKATLTVTADAKTREYGDANPTFTASYAGFKNSENLGSSGVTGSPSLTTTATAASPVGGSPYTITAALGTLASGNYSFSFVDGALTLTKAPLTVTADDKSKLYDGHVYSPFTESYSAFKNSETSAVLGGTLAFGGTAAAAVNAGSYVITPFGLTSGNYAIVFHDGALTINKAPLTITANDKSKTYGGADPVFDVNYTGFVNSETSTVLSGSTVFNFAGKPPTNYGPSTAVPVNAASYFIRPSGLTSGNYAITFAPGTYTINKATLTVTADSTSRPYGDANPTFTAGYGGFQNGENLATSGVTGNPSLTTTATTASGIGPYPIAAALGTLAAGNYTFTFVDGTLTITARAVTATADGKTKAYGDADPALTYQITSGSLVNGDTFSGSLTRVTGETVLGGPYAIQQGTLSLSTNYGLTFVGANLTITARPIRIAAVSQAKTYGDADPTLTFIVQGVGGGLVNGDTLATAFTGSLTRATGESVGTYAITQGTLTQGSNYTLANFNPGVLTITARAVAVTADAKTKAYGDADPALTYQITSGSLVNGDTFSGSLTRVTGETVLGGPYVIQQGTLALNGNYTLSYSGAALTITTRAITITANSGQTKEYGSADPVSYTYQITSGSLAFSDAFSGALARNPGESVGGYAITQGTLVLNGNYTLAYVGATFTITPHGIRIAAVSKTKTYGDADPTLTFVVQGVGGGLVNSDTPETALTGSLTRAAGEGVGTYAITQGTLTPGGNYTLLNFSPGVLTVAARAITVTANSGQTKEYGAAEPTNFTYQVTGGALQGTDTFSGALTRDPGEAVGGYAITQGSLTAGGNYTLAYVGATFTITTHGIRIAAVSKTKTYGDADPTLTFVVQGVGGGLVNGDVLTTALTGSLTRAAGEGVGTYAITQGTLTPSGNYTLLNFNPGALTIATRALQVTANSGQAKVYGSADPLPFAYHVTSGSLQGIDVLSGAPTRDAGETVASYAIRQGSLTAGANYSLSFVEAYFAINRAPLTITASSATIPQGSSVPTITATYGGFVNGETPAVLATPPSCSTTYVPVSPAGNYPTSCSGAVAANYAIAYVPGSVMVTPTPVPTTKAPVAQDKAVAVVVKPFHNDDDDDDRHDHDEFDRRGHDGHGWDHDLGDDDDDDGEWEHDADDSRAVRITLSATDADSTKLAFRIVSAPLHGVLSRIRKVSCTPDGHGGTSCTARAIYIPTPHYLGPDSFTYKANDGTQDSNVATVLVNLVPPFTTFTQGEWGSSSNGQNPGWFLASNFASVYGGGVTIGGAKTLHFTSPADIKNFLPAGGKAGALATTANNPSSSKGGVFAGQVLALQLNVDFSIAGKTRTGLGALVLTKGALKNQTVAQVLALANSVLGGNLGALPAGMSISDLSDIVSKINDDYDRGKEDDGYLK